MSGVYFYKTKKKLGCLFLQPRIFFREAEFGVKIYVRGRRLYGVEIESIVEDFYSKRVA